MNLFAVKIIRKIIFEIMDKKEPKEVMTSTKPNKNEQKVVPTTYERMRSSIFRASKIAQIIFCSLTIIAGLSFEISFIITGKKDWRYFLVTQGTLNDCPCSMTILDPRFWWDVFFWFFVEVSITGLIGAASNVICLQMFYAFVSIPVFPYCIIPWYVGAGIYNGWAIHSSPSSLLKEP